MKKFLVFSFLFLFLQGSLFAQDIPAKPNPPRLVNDFANQLNATELAQLESKLVTYNDSTSSQIVVVIVPTTGEYPIADYAFKLGRTWGVGQKDKDNGIVILWAATDRKVYIATGYGLEGAIPDAIAKRIISTVILPDFKTGMYFRGLDRGVDAIFKYATGEYKADPLDTTDDEISPFMVFIIVLLVILVFVWMSRNNRGGNGNNRGNRGGGLGGPIFWPYMTHSSGGSSSGNWGGGGGGGGFGGFGGGSFGGGGAGGDY